MDFDFIFLFQCICVSYLAYAVLATHRESKGILYEESVRQIMLEIKKENRAYINKFKKDLYRELKKELQADFNASYYQIIKTVKRLLKDDKK